MHIDTMRYVNRGTHGVAAFNTMRQYGYYTNQERGTGRSPAPVPIMVTALNRRSTLHPSTNSDHNSSPSSTAPGRLPRVVTTSFPIPVTLTLPPRLSPRSSAPIARTSWFRLSRTRSHTAIHRRLSEIHGRSSGTSAADRRGIIGGIQRSGVLDAWNHIMVGRDESEVWVMT
jgi:hypothetical protein